MANTKVTTGVIKDDAVGADQLASNSVVTASIVDNAITTAKINNDAILTAKISNSAVTNAKLAANSVDSDQYVDGSIDTAHIADGQITSAKLDTNISVSGELTVGSHLNMGDNDILKMGAGADLQIYHDSATGQSIISESGAGSLIIKGTNLFLQSADGAYLFRGNQGGAATLYYAGAAKIATTSSGIDVTGTAVTDGLTATGVIVTEGNAAVNDAQIGRLNFTNTNSNASSNPIRASILSGRQNSAWGGYLSLYTSTGTDAASEKVRIGETGNVGIGETSPSNLLHVKASDAGIAPHPSAQIVLERDGTNYLQFLTTAAGTSGLLFGDTNDIDVSKIYVDHNTTKMTFVNETVETMTLNGANVGIGTTSPTALLDVTVGNAKTANAGVWANLGKTNESSNYQALQCQQVGGSSASERRYEFQTIEQGVANAGSIVFQPSGGKVGIGTSSPNEALEVSGNIQFTTSVGTTSARPAVSSATLANGEIRAKNADAGDGGFLRLSAGGGSNTAQVSYIDIQGYSNNAGIGPKSVIIGTQGTDRVIIDGTGSVGIGTGTNTPKGVLDVQGGVYSNLTLSSAHGYSQNRNWDFISNSFGAGSWGGLSLRQSTGTGGTPSVSRFGIDINGKVGFGQTSPAARVHITDAANKSEGDSHLRIEGAGYSGFHWLNGTAYYIGQNSNGRHLRMYSGSNEGVGVYLGNGANSWASYSDERLKENIQDIGSVTEKIKDIRCVTYNRKDVDDENKHETIGFIAQDFVGKFDQVLDESKVLDTDEETRYSIRYTETIPILMKAIQEQQEQIETLKQEIQELKE